MVQIQPRRTDVLGKFCLWTLKSGIVVDQVCERDRRLGESARDRKDWQRAREWDTFSETDYQRSIFDGKPGQVSLGRNILKNEHGVCSWIIFIHWSYCLFVTVIQLSVMTSHAAPTCMRTSREDELICGWWLNLYS